MKDLKHILTARDHLVTGKTFDVLKNLRTGILETHPRPNKEELPLYYESKNYTSHNNNNKTDGLLAVLLQTGQDNFNQTKNKNMC